MNKKDLETKVKNKDAKMIINMGFLASLTTTATTGFLLKPKKQGPRTLHKYAAYSTIGFGIAHLAQHYNQIKNYVIKKYDQLKD